MTEETSGPQRWRSASGRWIDPARLTPSQHPDERTRDLGLDDLQGRETFAASVGTVRDMLRAMTERRASDLYLCSGQAPRLRIDGDVVSSGHSLVDDKYMTDMICEILDEVELEIFDETGDFDFAHNERGVGSFRVNLYRHRAGLGAVFRPIPNRVPTLDSLGVPPIVKELIYAERGLVLMTGPTGSGKSTTLAALVTEMAESRPLHISTVEDPIEFTIPRGKSVVAQRQVGLHAPTFAQALRDALREDVDVLMVGEMRDLETVSLALEAAETGLLVLATLHTPSAARAVTRILDIFPSGRQDQMRLMLADSLRAVICQRLIPRAGDKGRVAAVEVLMSTPSLSFSIREGRTQNIYTTIQTGRELGMITMEQSLLDLVKRGLISPEHVIDFAPRPDGLPQTKK